MGTPYALKYNGTLYYYITNLQGDILHIVDTSGAPVVSYTYSPYGKPLSTTGTLASTLGVDNPLRYRGYYYDTETGLYYVSSRYYDPEIGRFINADAYASTGQGILGNNMFAYCNNNPTNMADPSGEFGLIAGLVVGAVVGAISQYVGEVVGNIIEGKQGADIFKSESTIADFAGAALSGMVAATGIGLAGAVMANVGISTTTYLVNCGIKKENVTAEGFGWSVTMGVVSGFIGGSGVDVGGKGAILDIANDVVKNSSSLKKVAMYTAKKVAANRGLVVGTVRTIGSIIAPNVLTAGKDMLLD